MTQIALQDEIQKIEIQSGKTERLRIKVVSANLRERFVERYYLLEEAYHRHKDEPYAMRHAHISRDILSRISIVGDKDDLIVGRVKKIIPTKEDEQLVKQLRVENDPNAREEMSVSQGCPT